MAETVDLPAVGSVPTKVLIPVVAAAAGFVGWRYWKSRQTSDGETSPISDGEFGAVDSSVPGVIGAVSPTNSYGSGDRGSDDGNDPTRFTNNAQWTDYVVGKLQQSDSWSYSDIVTAIGNGLAGKPTNDMQQAILRAAVAVGSQPPSGQIIIVSGGNTNISLAPSSLRVMASTTSSVLLSWEPVAGASSYVVEYGASRKTTTASQLDVTGLAAGTSYTFLVSATNVAGVQGPKSSVAGKTAAIQPTGPRGYGWYHATGKVTGKAIAAKYNITAAQLYAWNPSLPATPPKGSYVKVRAASNPLTGYKGK
jgi:hypothetical protein